MLARLFLALGALVFALAPTVPIWAAAPQDVDDLAYYVAIVEQAKGHLLASREVYRLGQRVRADVHASHPIQELGYRLWRPVTRVDAALGARLQAALKEPGRAVEAKTPSREYDQIVDRTLALLEGAVARVVPADVRNDPSFQARVIRTLLDAVVEEYDEAIAEGRVVLEIEYQDAWGFLQRARTLWQVARGRLRPEGRSAGTVDEQFRVLGTALPAVTPPAVPIPANRVVCATGVIVEILGKEATR